MNFVLSVIAGACSMAGTVAFTLTVNAVNGNQGQQIPFWTPMAIGGTVFIIILVCLSIYEAVENGRFGRRR